MSTDAFGIKNGYGLTYGISKVIRNANAKAEVQGIHRHKYGDYGYYDDFFEIMLFIRGDSSFMIEGTTYALEPNDIMFAIPEEIHGIIHHSSCEYERYILRVTDDFFVINDLKPLYDCLKGKHFGE